jgi:hypothetical protein
MTTSELTAPPSPSLRSKFLVSALSVLIIVFLFVLAFMLGSLVAATGLHDPDSCWLLASGKYIWENGRLPNTDPFSYTFQLGDRPFVMYQWLTELLFYAILKVAGLAGLLTIAALSATMTFVALPLIASRRLSRSRAFVILLIVLMVGAASFHILIRPEIVSYTILSLWASLVLLWRKGMFDDANERMSELTPSSEEGVSLSEKLLENGIGWKVPLILSVLMIFWANFHSAFTLGLIVLVLLIAGYSFEIKRSNDDLARNLVAMAIGFVLCLVSTLINPRGWGLWLYLPSLYFSSMNKYIAELKPLGVKDLLDPTYAPFYLLSMLTVYLVVRALVHSHLEDFKVTGRVYSVLIVAFAVISGITARRMIPFDAILMTYESLFLLYLLFVRRGSERSILSFYDRLNIKLEQLLKPTLAASFSTFGIASLFGAYIICGRIVPPSLPQGSGAFHVPLEAIQFIKDHPLEGHIFNDAQFGDVMIWHIGTTMPVFVDTRYDMYGDRFIRDYQTLRFAEPGCLDVIQKYAIENVFAPTDSQLIKTLLKDRDWHELYRDKTAVILRKQSATNN